MAFTTCHLAHSPSTLACLCSLPTVYHTTCSAHRFHTAHILPPPCTPSTCLYFSHSSCACHCYCLPFRLTLFCFYLLQTVYHLELSHTFTIYLHTLPTYHRATAEPLCLRTCDATAAAAAAWFGSFVCAPFGFTTRPALSVLLSAVLWDRAVFLVCYRTLWCRRATNAKRLRRYTLPAPRTPPAH